MTARDELENELGGPLAGTDRLMATECADLLMLFRQARRQEAEGLVQAVDTMVRELPRPLRAPTKKIMFGNLLDR
ncbi:hypothetical protein AB0L57_30865 [Nocardia sp. NPDC052254]|uniref:hypothetical protein n=1 Tax=Nocardia sp. NPDC052254 TaxID=3155681 RepID=UPI003423E2D8